MHSIWKFVGNGNNYRKKNSHYGTQSFHHLRRILSRRKRAEHELWISDWSSETSASYVEYFLSRYWALNLQQEFTTFYLFICSHSSAPQTTPLFTHWLTTTLCNANTDTGFSSNFFKHKVFTIHLVLLHCIKIISAWCHLHLYHNQGKEHGVEHSVVSVCCWMYTTIPPLLPQGSVSKQGNTDYGWMKKWGKTIINDGACCIALEFCVLPSLHTFLLCTPQNTLLLLLPFHHKKNSTRERKNTQNVHKSQRLSSIYPSLFHFYPLLQFFSLYFLH